MFWPTLVCLTKSCKMQHCCVRAAEVSSTMYVAALTSDMQHTISPLFYLLTLSLLNKA